jgi:hypothetical protein
MALDGGGLGRERSAAAGLLAGLSGRVGRCEALPIGDCVDAGAAVVCASACRACSEDCWLRSRSTARTQLLGAVALCTAVTAFGAMSTLGAALAAANSARGGAGGNGLGSNGTGSLSRLKTSLRSTSSQPGHASV